MKKNTKRSKRKDKRTRNFIGEINRDKKLELLEILDKIGEIKNEK